MAYLTGVNRKHGEMAGKAAGYQCSRGFGGEFLNDQDRNPRKNGLF